MERLSQLLHVSFTGRSRWPAGLQPAPDTAQLLTPTPPELRNIDTPPARPGDFRPATTPTSSPAGLGRRICELGASQKSAWLADAVAACRSCSKPERRELMFIMVRHGLTPAEAAAADLAFPSRTLAGTLRRLAEADLDDWVREVADTIRHKPLHFDRQDGNRLLEEAFWRGDLRVGNALRLAGYRSRLDPLWHYRPAAREANMDALEAAAMNGGFDDAHRGLAATAARQADLPYIRRLHANGMRLHYSRHPNLILWNAVASGSAPLVDYLLRHGAVRNLQDSLRHAGTRSVMDLALQKADLAMADLLLSHGYTFQRTEQLRYKALIIYAAVNPQANTSTALLPEGIGRARAGAADSASTGASSILEPRRDSPRLPPSPVDEPPSA